MSSKPLSLKFEICLSWRHRPSLFLLNPVSKNTIKAGGSTAICEMCEWVMDGWIPLRLLRLLEHLAVLIKQRSVDRCDKQRSRAKDVITRRAETIFQTLPKAQRTRGLSSSCQSHIASSNANLDRISSSES